MSKQWFKKSSRIISEYATYLLFFTLPLSDKYLPSTIVLWAVSWLLWRFVNRAEHLSLSRNVKIGVLLLLAFTVLNFTSTLWGNELSLALKIMEKRLSFIIVTLVILLGVPEQIKFKRIIKSFILGSAFSLILFFIGFLYQCYTDETLLYQFDKLGFDHYLLAYKHPAYLALNLVLSMFLYLVYIAKKSWQQVVLLSILALTFFGVMFVANSRAGIISFSVLLVGTLFYLMRETKRYLRWPVMAVVMSAIVFGGIANSDKFYLMFDTSEHVAVRAPRKILWKTAWEMVKEKPLLGYGLGQSEELFVNKTKENGIFQADIVRLNVHNQFLEILLESGFVSLLLLLLSLYYFAKAVDVKRRWSIWVLYGFIAFAMFFESMLLRIAGVSLFVAMIYMVSLMGRSQREEIKKENGGTLFSGLIIFLAVLFVWSLLLSRTSVHLEYDPTCPHTYAYRGYKLVRKYDLPRPLPAELGALDDVDGALYDFEAVPSLWSNSAFLVNKVTESDIEKEDSLYFSTYCYVSPDFDGEWVRISFDKKENTLAKAYYDMTKKGIWQKLELSLVDHKGNVPAHFFFKKEDSNSFYDLHGYVIYAYPQYKVIRKEGRGLTQ